MMHNEPPSGTANGITPGNADGTAGAGVLHGPEMQAHLPAQLDEFERMLAPRTKVPLERLDEYLALSEYELRDEVHAVARILKRFAQAVAGSIEEPDATGNFLQQLDLRSVSRDHDWRAVFSELRARDEGYESHKRALVVKYLQYLSFRRKLLGFIYAKKAGLSETDEFTELSLHTPGGTRPGRWVGSGKPHAPGELTRASHIRLPLGEPVELDLPSGGKLELMLAGHVFRLVGTRVPCLVDQNGVMYFIKQGRNIVGRHPDSDVSVDPDFRDISRAHMIVEWGGAGAVTVTDLSTRGTFVPHASIRGNNAAPTSH